MTLLVFECIIRLLEKAQVGVNDRDEMLRLSRGQHYQLACAKHFEVSHKGAESLISMDGVGNHPNAFFAASMAYYKELNKDKTAPAGGVKRETSSSSSSQNSSSQEPSPMEQDEPAAAPSTDMAVDAGGDGGSPSGN